VLAIEIGHSVRRFMRTCNKQNYRHYFPGKGGNSHLLLKSIDANVKTVQTGLAIRLFGLRFLDAHTSKWEGYKGSVAEKTNACIYCLLKCMGIPWRYYCVICFHTGGHGEKIITKFTYHDDYVPYGPVMKMICHVQDISLDLFILWFLSLWNWYDE
jgi:hypothetical protein